MVIAFPVHLAYTSPPAYVLTTSQINHMNRQYNGRSRNVLIELGLNPSGVEKEFAKSNSPIPSYARSSEPLQNLGEKFNGLESKLSGFATTPFDSDSDEIAAMFADYELGFERVGPYMSGTQKRNLGEIDVEDDVLTHSVKPLGVRVHSLATIQRQDRQIRNETPSSYMRRRISDDI